MKFNKLVKLAVLAATVAASANAMADVSPKFYVGGDLNYTKFKFNSDIQNFSDTVSDAGFAVSKKMKRPGVGVFVGANFNECVGLELGTVFHSAVKSEISGNVLGVAAADADLSLKLRTVYLDVNGYYNVADNVKLIGSVGATLDQARGDINANVSVPALGLTASVSESGTTKAKFGARVGVGAQYNFTENFATRAMVRYSKLSKETGFKSATSASLGVLYSF